MQTLQIDEKKARSLYNTATPEFKTMLVDTFGEKFFTVKITDRVKTFKDACQVAEFKEDHSSFNGLPGDDEAAYRKLKVIVLALNEGWEPDWNNSNEYKWCPWFYMDTPGFRFYGSDFDLSFSGTTGGSRLCFKSEELATYAGKQFIDIYKDFLTNQ